MAKTSIPTLSLYFSPEEYARLEAFAAGNRHSVAATVKYLFEDALSGKLAPDLKTKKQPKPAKRAGAQVSAEFKAKVDAYKAQTTLPLSDIVLRLIDAAEQQGEQK